MADIKNHPAFIAFRGSNAKTSDANGSQAEDLAAAKKEVCEDTKYADKNPGGEQGRA